MVTLTETMDRTSLFLDRIDPIDCVLGRVALKRTKEMMEFALQKGGRATHGDGVRADEELRARTHDKLRIKQGRGSDF